MSDDLRRLVAEHRAGRVAKGDYIAAAHALHARLFEYPSLLEAGSIARIEIAADGVDFVTRDGVRFRLDPADRRHPPLEALNFGRFEGDDEAMLDRLVAANDVVLDVGANVGWHALRLAKTRPGCRVFAFEPVPETFALLRLNRELNRSENVSIHDFGLSDRDGTIRFFVDPAMPVGASAADNSRAAGVAEIAVKVRRLDDVAGDLNIAPDVVKVDVEGAELSVFRGGLATLTATCPAIFCEMLRKWSRNFGYQPNDIIDLLGGIGYDCQEVDGDRLRPRPRVDDATTATNFVFLHRERHRRLLESLTGG